MTCAAFVVTVQYDSLIECTCFCTDVDFVALIIDRLALLPLIAFVLDDAPLMVT